MKRHLQTLLTIAALALAAVGCNKSDAPAGGGSASIDTSGVQTIFANAEGPIKAAAEKAVAAVKSADYSGAMAELQKLAGDVKLTPEQKQAVTDLIEKVKAALSGAAGKAAEGASKAVGDLQKTLPK